MVPRFHLLVVVFGCVCISLANSAEGGRKNLINAEVYTNLFLRQREAQKTLLNHIRGIDDYAKRYKILKIGLLKIQDVIETNRIVLQSEQYSPSQGFPTTEKTIDAVVLILENTCLFGDLFLHMPDMSYKILSKQPDWHAQMNWSIEFAGQFHSSVLDEKANELLTLLDQEINVEKRSDNYINPYSEHSSIKTKSDKKKRERKKIKKGPQLSSGRNEL